MTSRARQADTDADVELRACLNAVPPESFTMIAGAGSGKTTSLIKALAAIIEMHSEKLRLHRQQVACITYTEVAAGEIWADVGNNPLVHVATIHSFMWSLAKGFQSDIREWVANRIEEKLAELREAAENFGPRVQQKTRDKNQKDIARYEKQRDTISRVRSFRYSTGSDYPSGILGHDDIIKMVPALLSERPLFRTLLAQRYPFLFVDESQDTMEHVVAALKAVDQQMGATFCLGFFGDPMQRIYPTGIGAINVEVGWRNITKPENFRCPSTVLAVANLIRRDGDGLVQTRGRMKDRNGVLESVTGNAHLFVLPADERRYERLAQIRSWAARHTGDNAWIEGRDASSVKLLVIAHRMAATRLQFGDLYAALNDKAPEAFKSGLLDASAWPVRPFMSFVVPVVQAARDGKEFEVMQLFRSESPLLARENLKGINVAERLEKVNAVTQRLVEMMAENSNATTAQVLRLLYEEGVLRLDPRILSYLNLPAGADAAPKENPPEDEDDGEELSKEIAAMESFLSCRASQFWGYRTYVTEQSPFSTQQGIKGAEFERVLVVLDDDEGTHTQFSYDKLFGLKPLSDRDQANIRDGKETAVERTRRLFYVCCTRALQDLVVVLFTANVAPAKGKLSALGLFAPEALHDLAALDGL